MIRAEISALATCPVRSEGAGDPRPHQFVEYTRPLGRRTSTTITTFSDCVFCGAARLVVGVPK